MNWIEAQHEMLDGNMVTNGYDDVYKLDESGYLMELDLPTGEWTRSMDPDPSLRESSYEIYDPRPRKNFSEALRLMLDGKTCEYEGDKYYFESGVLKRKAADWRADNSAISELMVKGDWYEVKT